MAEHENPHDPEANKIHHPAKQRREANPGVDDTQARERAVRETPPHKQEKHSGGY